MAVLDGGSAIAITAAFIFVAHLAKLLVDIRKSWHEGSLAKEQRKRLVKKAQLAAGKKPKKGTKKVSCGVLFMRMDVKRKKRPRRNDSNTDLVRWALGLVGARRAEQRKGSDQGIDGRLYFHDEGIRVCKSSPSPKLLDGKGIAYPQHSHP